MEKVPELYPPRVFADRFPEVNIVERPSLSFVYKLNIPPWLECKQDSHGSDQDTHSSFGTSLLFFV